MAKAPPPRNFPGEFFVLSYDFGERAYTMIVDDESRSSYNLGELEAVINYFRFTDAAELGNRAIDLAREFGAAMVVPAENRVFTVNSQPQRGDRPKDIFATRPEERAYHLPEL